MERLDKIIATQTEYSRKEVKELVNKKRVIVNGEIVCKSDIKLDNNAEIKIDGCVINVKKNVYLILNKPQGYISATEDKSQATVLELIPKEYSHRNIFPVGRLDKDTTGLMVLSDDGEFAHNVLSPKKHVKKIYEVTLDIPVTKEMQIAFKDGIKLIDGICKAADLEITGEYTCVVTLVEGRYHQIKRMFGCFAGKVIKLNRIGMGNLILPKDLKLGECRELREEELDKIKERVK